MGDPSRSFYEGSFLAILIEFTEDCFVLCLRDEMLWSGVFINF